MAYHNGNNPQNNTTRCSCAISITRTRVIRQCKTARHFAMSPPRRLHFCLCPVFAPVLAPVLALPCPTRLRTCCLESKDKKVEGKLAILQSFHRHVDRPIFHTLLGVIEARSTILAQRKFRSAAISLHKLGALVGLFILGS